MGRVLAVTSIAALVAWGHAQRPDVWMSLTPTPFLLIGVPLGIFLGFRNGAAYDRFWEGRRLWGQLVNTSRTLGRQCLSLLIPVDAADVNSIALRQRIVALIVAFANALRERLRAEPTGTWLETLAETDRNDLRIHIAGPAAANVPWWILVRLGSLVSPHVGKGPGGACAVVATEQSLASLADVLGGCERIRHTPIPFSYTVLMHRIVAVYCGLLPLGIADTVGSLTPVVVFFVSYALFGLDAVGEEIEQPFGTDTNDLPLTRLCQTIDRDMQALLGHQPGALAAETDLQVVT